MVRRILAAAALTGAVAVATAGVGTSVAEATTTTGSSPGSVPAACSKAPAVLSRIAVRQARAQSWLPKAERRLAVAEQAGKVAAAGRIQHRIDLAQTWEARASARVQRIDRRCPGASPTGGTQSS